MGTACYTASVTSSSEAPGQRIAGSKCLGPCPMRYSALEIMGEATVFLCTQQVPWRQDTGLMKRLDNFITSRNIMFGLELCLFPCSLSGLFQVHGFADHRAYRDGHGWLQ